MVCNNIFFLPTYSFQIVNNQNNDVYDDDDDDIQSIILLYVILFQIGSSFMKIFNQTFAWINRLNIFLFNDLILFHFSPHTVMIVFLSWIFLKKNSFSFWWWLLFQKNDNHFVYQTKLFCVLFFFFKFDSSPLWSSSLSFYGSNTQAYTFEKVICFRNKQITEKCLFYWWSRKL